MTLAGIPYQYHVSCRVRSTTQGIDAEPSEQAGFVIEANTPMATLAVWLAGDSMTNRAWLRCSAEDLKRLLGMPKDDWIDFSTSEDGVGVDWMVNELDHDEATHTVEMSGSASLGEFEFEVRIIPAVSNQEIACGRGCGIPVEPKTLSRVALEEIASYVQAGLFLDVAPATDVWSLDKDVSGADFIDHMTSILSKHDLVPEPEEAGE